ncbi:hypothetical protein JW826_02085 [Candidatus Woesearchaeota archaeon]|nr:hypothetical protein [Candidatus Woesearchaeota archaeon]
MLSASYKLAQAIQATGIENIPLIFLPSEVPPKIPLGSNVVVGVAQENPWSGEAIYFTTQARTVNEAQIEDITPVGKTTFLAEEERAYKLQKPRLAEMARDPINILRDYVQKREAWAQVKRTPEVVDITARL